jgi:hypothetical protein
VQKYWHKGAFFQGEDEEGGESILGDVMHRDYDAPTGEDKFDRQILPKIMQVRRLAGLSATNGFVHSVWRHSLALQPKHCWILCWCRFEISAGADEQNGSTCLLRIRRCKQRTLRFQSRSLDSSRREMALIAHELLRHEPGMLAQTASRHQQVLVQLVELAYTCWNLHVSISEVGNTIHLY